MLLCDLIKSMSATISAEECDWPSQGLKVVCQQEDDARVVNEYTVNKHLLALRHVWPCHVNKSEARKLGEF